MPGPLYVVTEPGSEEGERPVWGEYPVGVPISKSSSSSGSSQLVNSWIFESSEGTSNMPRRREAE